MDLLIYPRVFTVSNSQNLTIFLPRARLKFSASAVKGRVKSGEAEKTGAAIVWYKHDLRVDDHSGLIAAASQYRTLVPVYVFDHRIVSRFSDEILELLLFALEDLRKLLKEQGSNLMIRFGSAERVIGQLVKEVTASSIFVEEEMEYELCRMLDIVNETLSTVSFDGRNPEIVKWSTPFYDVKSLDDLPLSYNEFKKLKFPVVSSLLPPTLPGPPMDLFWGALPTLDDLKKFIDDSSNVGNLEKEWNSFKKFSAQSVLQRKRLKELEKAELIESNQQIAISKTTQRRPEKSAFVTRQGNLVGGGASIVLNALAAYLRYLEGTARDEWQEVHDKLREAESREGASFHSLFGSSLLLGIISARRVYYEAIKYEKDRNGGFLSPFGYSTTTIAAAIDTVYSMEWYRLLTLQGQRRERGNYSVRIWRWNGHLIQYTVAGHEGPPILLVHGFGAFLEHYRDNANPIAESGNRVWAITLLGFGKSEKPNVLYTELLWAELLRDFIIEVIGEPVHLVGNSIGGYFVAILAGLWPALAKSVVLINSAGNIIPGYSAPSYSEDRRNLGAAARLGARLLLLYLRFNIRNILKSFYPTKTDRANDELIHEMLRASYDPGAIVVLESIFIFDLSLPLNYLLEGYGKILVIQGMKDPLSDSKSKLAMLREHCRGIVTKEIDAGHCPQDEQPNEVNSIIEEWVVSIESENIRYDTGELVPAQNQINKLNELPDASQNGAQEAVATVV
ncbi:DNA photolyase [Forsythia ovata]|uniref:DNA photolyase n=1 Tax=Forsythia ovata TaxID=205694 RepID=A0ABD1WL10_9LAMI